MIGAQAPFDLDTTFKCAVQYRNVNSVAVMPDGKLLISGRLNFHWVTGEWSLARLNADGTRDLSWNFGVPAGNKITPWNNGYYVNNGAIIRRLNDDGYLDPTFIMMNNGPYFSSGQGGDYHVFPDGRVLMTGLHSLEDTIRGYTGLHSLIWFSNTGYLDTTQHHRKSNNAIYTIKEQPDGKFLCSGLCSVYEGQPVGRVFRVNADGDLDTTFQTDFDLGEASTFNALANGRILVSGYLGQPGGNDTLHMMRLLPNGALDSSFNNTLQVLGDVNGHLPVMHTRLEDGRIVLHGNFSSIDGQPRSGVAMIDSTGHLINDAFATPACGTYNDGFFDFHTTNGMVPDQAGNWYIYGTYIGYDDGTTNDPQQRFVSRLYGLNVGVREVEAPLQLELFPNPAHTSTTVRWAKPGSYQLRLFDVTGREVHRSAHQGTEAVLDLAGLPAGPYVIQITDQTHRQWSRTLIVEP